MSTIVMYQPIPASVWYKPSVPAWKFGCTYKIQRKLRSLSTRYSEEFISSLAIRMNIRHQQKKIKVAPVDSDDEYFDAHEPEKEVFYDAPEPIIEPWTEDDEDLLCERVKQSQSIDPVVSDRWMLSFSQFVPHLIKGLEAGSIPHYQRNGCLIPMRSMNDILDVTWPDPLNMACIRFQSESSLLGGGRDKQRINRKKKKLRKKPPRFSMVKAGQLGLRNPPAMTHFPAKILDEWRYEQIIESDGAGSFSAFFHLRNPLKALNGSGTYSRAQGFANLYDEYKPLSLIVVVDFLQLSTFNGFSRMAVDQDTIPTGTYTPADLKDNEYMREFSGTNQISYQSHIVPLAEGTSNDRPAIIMQKGWYDFNTPPDEGFIVFTGDRFPTGQRIANITLTLRVCMRRRRTVNNAREKRIELEEKEQKDLLTKIKRMSC